ncbi:hypothetical protein BDP27DRAFT_1443457 [Rhodocollybia butyracea]|uniref:Uncharacterized protein n=1 Tax=Rhodocollybia butyracea TaxID=206335 RepID=A0A9P5Q7G4_9AGAR|nr:hypothetical protein BDP27DRAFT_1443457 [Rhodocollybia butyracea]
MQRNLVPPTATPSTLSVDSSENYSTSTVSSATFRGLGSLSGKALRNFGKLTLKGIEQVIIFRRLSTIAARFPHHAGAKFPGLTEMYMDLLELSRPELYSEFIRIRALQMLVAQIGSRSGKKLVEVLSNWPVVELCLIVRDVTSRMDPIRPLYLQDPVVLEYQKHISKGEGHSLAPLIDFLSMLNSSRSQAFPEILSAGVHDLLLHLYVSDFRDPMATANKRAFIRTSGLFAACSSYLLEACSDHSSYEHLERYPIHGLWSLSPMLSFGKMETDRCSQRRETWRLVGLRGIQWRISSAFDMLMDWERSFTSDFLFDLLIDLVEFSGSAMLPNEICFRALRSLHCLAIQDEVVGWGLRMYFDQTPLDHAQDVFSLIIQRVTSVLLLDTPVAAPFYQFCCPDGCHLRQNAAVHLIHRLTSSARRSTILHQVLIRADIEGLLNSATKFVESLDGEPWQRWLLFGMDATDHADAVYRAEVLSFAWRVFFQHPYSREVFPSLRLQAWVDELSEQIEREDAYLWII